MLQPQLLWGLSAEVAPVCLSSVRGPKLDAVSTCSLISTIWREIILSLTYELGPCPYGPGPVGHLCCQGTPWACVQLTAHHHSRAFSAELLFGPSILIPCCYNRSSLPETGLRIFSVLNFMRSCRPTPPPSGWQPCQPAYGVFADDWCRLQIKQSCTSLSPPDKFVESFL